MMCTFVVQFMYVRPWKHRTFYPNHNRVASQQSSTCIKSTIPLLTCMHLWHCDVQQCIKFCWVNVKNISLTRQNNESRQNTMQTVSVRQILTKIITCNIQLKDDEIHVWLNLFQCKTLKGENYYISDKNLFL